MKVLSYANSSSNAPFLPYSFERRTVGESDVGIKIKYCGICHSDIHTARGEWGKAFYPCVPGHEIVGEVLSVGRNVKKYQIGDLVGVGCMVGSCKKCPSCLESLEQYCDSQKGFQGTYNSECEKEGYTKGGYSSYIVVDEDFVLSIPKNLDLAKAAPLLCAGVTTYSPLKYLNVGPNSKVAILGLGGLGHMGVKLAKSFGAKVSVLSHSPQKKEDAQKLGADNFILANSGEVKNYENYFDVILDTVSADHDLGLMLSLLKREGTLALVGLPEHNLSLPCFPIILKRRRILGSIIGGIKETQEMLDHCAKHNITSDIEIIEPNYINTAYERILKSDIKYRFVIDCEKF